MNNTANNAANNAMSTDSISQQVENLSSQMGINKADVLAFAQSIANSLNNDGISAEKFQQHANDLMPAYAAFAVKKQRAFFETYQTNDQARAAFQMKVLGDIKIQLA